MKNSVFLLALAAAGGTALASCSNPDKPGETNVENGGAKTFIPRQTPPVTGQDSATAGLHRDTVRHPTAEQLYERTARRTRPRPDTGR